MRVLLCVALGSLLRRAPTTALVEDSDEEIAQTLVAQLKRYEHDLHLDDVSSANATGGTHTCGCMSPQDEGRRDLKNLRWLHVPKTGTSFWSTIYQYACRVKGTMDLNISPFWKEPGCGSCYDFAVKERFPPEEFCAADSFASLETQHRPLGGPDVPENTVTFLRDPSERLLSAAVNSHMSGFGPENFQAARAKCYSPTVNAQCFVNYPGIRGCQARMLTGGMCADDGAVAGMARPVDVQQAVAIVKRLGFVGLTEEWNDSVCLFHKMFGGKVRQEEFKNFHVSKMEKPDVDVTDNLDEPVYQAAKARFHALLKEHQAEKCYHFKPAACEPKKCEDVGFECGGPTPDGCGGTMQCGQCPQHRAGPAQCVNNKCHAQQPHATDTFAVSSFRHGVHR